MNNIINILSIIFCLIDALLYIKCTKEISNKNIKKYNYIIFILLYIIVFQINLYFQSNILSTISSILLIYSLCKIFFNIDKSNSLYLALIINEIFLICYGLGNCIKNIISPIIHKIFSNNYFLINTMIIFTGEFISILLIIITVKIISKYNIKIIPTNKYSEPLFIILLLILFIGYNYIYLIYGNTITIDKNGFILGFNNSIDFIIQILSLLTIISILYYYKKIINNIELDKKLILLEKEKLYQKQYIEEAKIKYNNTKFIRHDIKNHILILKNLIKKNDSKNTIKYLNQLQNKIDNLSFKYNTNNPILNILIEDKFNIAKSYDIKTNFDFFIPNNYINIIDDIDFCIIFSNAIDNAINACKNINNSKYINIAGFFKENFLLIEFENSCNINKSVVKSTGLLSIENIANKYNGNIIIEYSKNHFTLSVLLNIPHHY